MSILTEVNAVVDALETALAAVPGIRVMRVDGEDQVESGLQSLPVAFVVAAAEVPQEPVRAGSSAQGLVRSIETLVAGRDPSHCAEGADLYTVMELADAALLGFKIRGASSASHMKKGVSKRLRVLPQGQLWQRSWTYWIPASEV